MPNVRVGSTSWAAYRGSSRDRAPGRMLAAIIRRERHSYASPNWRSRDRFHKYRIIMQPTMATQPTAATSEIIVQTAGKVLLLWSYTLQAPWKQQQ